VPCASCASIAVRQIWDEVIGLPVKESQEVEALTKEEIVALLGLAKSPFEHILLQRLLSEMPIL
jgi:hypothetical protein